MIINDSIYGSFNLTPLLEELVNAKAVQRLKDIHQGGSSYLINPNWNVTRYEHSIGVMILISMMGGSIKEQIAGLLHDISHTAFSHVIDFALDNKNEDYHEEIFDKVVENSEIPMILKKYGYDYKEILEDETKWTILEKSAPSLCADRIDYTLRDMFHYGFISMEEINEFIKSLKVINGEIVITSIDKAEWFVESYYKEVIVFFMNPLNVYSSDRLAKALRLSLSLNELTFDDLLKTDYEVFSILKDSKSKEILDLINSINPNVRVIENKNDYDIHKVNKLRLINPFIFVDNILCRASDKSPTIKTLNEKALKKSLEGVHIKILT